MSAQYPHPPPPPHRHARVDAGELRPKRLWYGVGAGVIVLGVVVGVVAFLLMMIRTLGLPDFAAEVQGSGQAVFTVGAEDPRFELYTSPADADASACSLLPPDGGELGFGPPGNSHDINVNGESWSLVGALTPGQAGEYTLVCEGDAQTVYAVAEGNSGAELFGGIASALTTFVGVPFAGVVVGLSILIVTGVRRQRHKTRLLAARAGYPHGTPP